MRGKATPLQCGEVGRRITPAYAGKSSHSFHLAFFLEDHPRLCGEKFYLLRKFFQTTESPPPMRGKESTSLNGFCAVWDHPRLCGEKVNRFVVVVQPRRITPAYAGKSARWLQGQPLL